MLFCSLLTFTSLYLLERKDKYNEHLLTFRDLCHSTGYFNKWVTSGKRNRSAPTSWRSCVYIYTSVDKRSQIYFATVSPVVLFGSSLMRFGNRSIAFCTIGGRSLQAVTEIGRGCVCDLRYVCHLVFFFSFFLFGDFC